MKEALVKCWPCKDTHKHTHRHTHTHTHTHTHIYTQVHYDPKQGKQGHANLPVTRITTCCSRSLGYVAASVLGGTKTNTSPRGADSLPWLGIGYLVAPLLVARIQAHWLVQVSPACGGVEASGTASTHVADLCKGGRCPGRRVSSRLH